MATTPGTKRRETRTGMVGDDRDLIDPMQEPLGSMDRPVPRGSDIDDLNLSQTDTVRRPGDPGYTATPRTVAGRSGSATSTFAIVAVILLAAFLVALYLGSNRSQVATGVGTTQAPVADSTGGTTGTDTTGSTTTAPPPPEAGSGNADAPASGTTTTTTPANP